MTFMTKIWNAIKKFVRTTDMLVLTICVALSVLSLLLIAGILRTDYVGMLRLSDSSFWVQFVAITLGIVSACVLSRADYQLYTRTWMFHYPFFYALTILTFFIGVGGAGREDDKLWLNIPFVNFSLQPSEFLKISFIITMAYHISKVRKEINRPRNLLLLLAHTIVPVVLIQIQGDTGTALMFFLIAVTMIFVAGLNWKYIVGLFGAVVAAVPILWFFVLEKYQINRFLALYSGATSGVDAAYIYQQERAKIVIGSGQLFGKGLFSDSHLSVPEIHNDFIFSFLAESFGFIGAFGVIILFTVLCVRLLYNGYKAFDSEGQLIFVGVFAMIAFGVLINIGMNLSILPVIGNPLPFLSRGGSSTLSTFVAIGVALSVYHSKKAIL
jgi:Bacterial cell division membrane protein